MNWNELVGQERAKSKLDFHFRAAEAGEALPSFMFCGPRGFGKTAIGEAFGLRIREMTKGEKRLFTLNCASIKNLKSFWNSVIIPVVNDRDVTILFDEASELPTDVTMALLTMINPNSNDRNSYSFDDMTVDVDLKRQSFMFASTEPQRIFHALMDRCHRIDLEEYSHADLSTILRKNLGDLEVEEEVMKDVTPTLRGNARQAVRMAKNIRTYLAPLRKTLLGAEEWLRLSQELDILPMGLSRLELQVLRILARGPLTLTRLAATMFMSKASLQKDVELYLMRQNLMLIDVDGRKITQNGQQYLNNLDKV